MHIYIYIYIKVLPFQCLMGFALATLQVNNKTTIFRVLTKNHISETFRIDVVNKSMLVRSKTNHHFLVFGGDVTLRPRRPLGPSRTPARPTDR